MSNAIMGLRLKQQLTLTPRLQQSVKLLQLSALECVQELNQAISLNPFLEEPQDEPEAAPEAASQEAAPEEDGTQQPPERSELDFSSIGSGSHAGGEDLPDWTEWTACSRDARRLAERAAVASGTSRARLHARPPGGRCARRRRFPAPAARGAALDDAGRRPGRARNCAAHRADPGARRHSGTGPRRVPFAAAPGDGPGNPLARPGDRNRAAPPGIDGDARPDPFTACPALHRRRIARGDRADSRARSAPRFAGRRLSSRARSFRTWSCARTKSAGW